MIKTFRGQLADGAQQRIKLSTNQGLIGYRLVRFETIISTPGIGDHEYVTKIYKVKRTTVDAIVNFADNTLIGVSAISHSASISEPYSQTIIVEGDTFNQDLYVTGSATAGTGTMNYYIELEKVKLTEHEAAVATLKDMRGRE